MATTVLQILWGLHLEQLFNSARIWTNLGRIIPKWVQNDMMTRDNIGVSASEEHQDARGTTVLLTFLRLEENIYISSTCFMSCSPIQEKNWSVVELKWSPELERT